MKQEQIDYSGIKNLGFQETECQDDVYFNKYGFPYVITELNLTKKIHINWEKDTRLAEMRRCDKEGNILGSIPIQNINHLKQMVDFFKDKIHYQIENIA